jgi:hypothetical protein
MERNINGGILLPTAYTQEYWRPSYNTVILYTLMNAEYDTGRVAWENKSALKEHCFHCKEGDLILLSIFMLHSIFLKAFCNCISDFARFVWV